MSVQVWFQAMVGELVCIETEDNEFSGRLSDLTDDPFLTLRLVDVIDADGEELGTTILSWRQGYRISVLSPQAAVN